MAPKNDDQIPEEYKYSWDKDSTQTLEQFLEKFRPSMVQNDGTKPWIWVKASQPEKRCETEDMEKAIDEGSVVLNELTKKVESIKNDASIPVRSSKKTGAKSKKEIREAAQAEATKKLEQISVKHGYVNGKWLVFAPADKVDAIWSTVATSLVSGPLAATCAYATKVATSPQDGFPNYQHIICVYMPDIYDKHEVLEVMKVLLGSHGLTLSGVKSDLYTYLGIDSKHPSGIQSTVWKNSALMPDGEMKAMKEAYFTGLANKKSQGLQKTAEDLQIEPREGTETKAKPKTKLKKKGAELVSSDEDGEVEDKEKELSKTKPKSKLKKKVGGKEADPFVSSDEEGLKRRSVAKKPVTLKRKESSDEVEEDEDQKGKAKRARV